VTVTVAVMQMQTVLKQALEAAVAGDKRNLDEIFTEDVVGWAPNITVGSRAELAAEFEEQQDSLSNIVLSLDALYVVGDTAIAEWRVGADHTGPYAIGETVIAPTGRSIVLAGATFAEFRGNQIRAFRSYFDDAALLEQLLPEP
jgi:ketosteroid isomerase-like protein